MSTNTVDTSAYRVAMSRFPSGVAIVTTQDDDGKAHGFTASSFCSVSLDPPLILVCLSTSATSYPAFARNHRFAVSILRTSQVDLARVFASKVTDKFAHGRFRRTEGGATVLEEALATLECSLSNRYDAGDHMIMLGAVEQVLLDEAGGPAVYFERDFRRLCTRSGCESA
jgi:flavin reductase ActVB